MSKKLTCNLKTFTRKHRLTEYFDDYNVMPIAKKQKKKKKERQKKESLVKFKSKFYLQTNENKELETHISIINNIDITNEKSN